MPPFIQPFLTYSCLYFLHFLTCFFTKCFISRFNYSTIYKTCQEGFQKKPPVYFIFVCFFAYLCHYWLFFMLRKHRFNKMCHRINQRFLKYAVWPSCTSKAPNALPLNPLYFRSAVRIAIAFLYFSHRSSVFSSILSASIRDRSLLCTRSANLMRLAIGSREIASM